MNPLDGLFTALSREPDIGGAELRAWDAADRYLLEFARERFPDALADEVAVVDDTHGALALGATAFGARAVRVHQDSMIARRALAANAERTGLAQPSAHPLDELVTPDTRLVIVRLPRAHDRLDAIARAVAAGAAPQLVLLAGNRVKHMTPTQNPVLAAAFGRVDVAPARGKARILVASEALRVAAATPRRATVAADLDVVAHPGVFAGATIDIGTRALVDTFGALPAFDVALDLACGSGVMASRLALIAPDARVIASDVSALAAASARDTAAANGVTVEVHHDDGAHFLADASVDLVVLNPPFHSGSTITTELARRLVAEAARVLRAGGELRCVWNSHLSYRPMLESLVGPTRQLARTPKFTVTASARRPDAGPTR